MKRIISVQFERKRKHLTNYRKRLKLIVSGKDRLVVRKTSRQIIVQLIKYDEKGDKVLVTALSNQLRKHGWQLGSKNLPAAYLAGFLAAKLALSKNVKQAILDAGQSKPESRGRIYAALKGAIDGGLEIPASKEILPAEDRILGKHLKNPDKAEQMLREAKAKISEARK